MIDLIQQRLERYQAGNAVEEEQALKEILQEVALYALWRADFFEIAAFQGGTSLRILHGLPRFSEVLDFILKRPDENFAWTAFLNPLVEGLETFGLKSEVLDKGRMDQRVRKALLKDNSVARQLRLGFYEGPADRKLSIKLEIDINPPEGSGYEYRYLDFPLDFEVCQQDLSSNFALKIHALLCRPFLKGRDWYDFNWYVKQGVSPNLGLLRAALEQYGPWQGRVLAVDRQWLEDTLREKIATIDWTAAADDVRRFLKPVEQESLRLWSNRFFQSKLDQLPNE
jgi:hypothetical protein